MGTISATTEYSQSVLERQLSIISDRGNISVVLLVDDQPMVAEGIRRMLMEEQNIEFHYCQDPTKAVEKASEIQPTIILQDLILPNISGYELVKQYKLEPATQNIPIIVLSTRDDPNDKRLAFENGVNDYLVKLPDSVELIARINALTKYYLTQVERDSAFIEMGILKEQLQKSNAELQKLTCLDGLTGIANRRSFDSFLNKECLRTARDKLPISLLLMDIDFFKRYNDNYGHLAGDESIRSVALALKHAVQRPADLVARYGGEEFAVVLPNTDSEGALIIAEGLRESVQSLEIDHSYSNISDIITISIGIATTDHDGSYLPLSLIESADKALYSAKHAGRNRCIQFGKELTVA